MKMLFEMFLTKKMDVSMSKNLSNSKLKTIDQQYYRWERCWCLIRTKVFSLPLRKLKFFRVGIIKILSYYIFDNNYGENKTVYTS